MNTNTPCGDAGYKCS